MTRAELEAILAKPLADQPGPSVDEFDPWSDIMRNIHGSYSSESDELAVAALIAVRDGKTFEFIEQRGFVGEFMLYVLSGFGLTDYGTSPRGAWPDSGLADLWNPLIAKWVTYADQQWGVNNWRAA